MNNKKTRDRNVNAVSHNMTGLRFVVLRTESEAEFQASVADYRKDFFPVGRAEGDLVYEMAVCKWRQQRAWRIETEPPTNQESLISVNPRPSVAKNETPKPPKLPMAS